MELNDSKIAIAGIVVLEVAMGIVAYFTGGSVDIGTVGMGITAIAGITGYDMAKKA